MKLQSIFLFVAVLGLTPIALSYGYAPAISLDYLFGIDASPINVTHIFRAVMGLYLALALFWIAGALLKKYPRLAVLIKIIFQK